MNKPSSEEIVRCYLAMEKAREAYEKARQDFQSLIKQIDSEWETVSSKGKCDPIILDIEEPDEPTESDSERLSFGKTLLFYRKKARLTQAELAEKLNLSNAAIGLYENDISLPRFKRLALLSEVLDIDYDELVKVYRPKRHRKHISVSDDSRIKLPAYSKMINNARIEIGLPLSIAATSAKTSVETFKAWENGRIVPKHTDIGNICGALGLDYETLKHACHTSANAKQLLFSTILRSTRTQLGFKQEDLDDILDLEPGTTNKVELGSYGLPMSLLNRYCDVLDIDRSKIC